MEEKEKKKKEEAEIKNLQKQEEEKRTLLESCRELSRVVARQLRCCWLVVALLLRCCCNVVARYCCSGVGVGGSCCSCGAVAVITRSTEACQQSLTSHFPYFSICGAQRPNLAAPQLSNICAYIIFLLFHILFFFISSTSSSLGSYDKSNTNEPLSFTISHFPLSFSKR